MSEKPQDVQTVDLPGLKSSEIDLMSADVRIGQAESGTEHPQLLLEGGSDAFKHSFNDGHLTVQEGGESDITIDGDSTVVISGVDKSRINIQGGRIRAGGVVIGSNISSRGSVQIGNVQVSSGKDGTRVVLGGDINESARQRATLLLPEGHMASHNISTQSGDIDLENLTARILKIATQSGDLALQSVGVESISAETQGGDVDMEGVKSSSTVKAKTMAGNVTLRDSSAPAWNLETMSGNIRAKSVEGELDTSTMSGRTRVS